MVFVGGYGFVFVAQDEKTGKDYALKVSVFFACTNSSYLLNIFIIVLVIARDLLIKSVK